MKRKDILLLLIPTFIVVLLWVVFNVYHSYINSTIPIDVNTQILYIEPEFDLKTIEELKKRELINPIDTVETQSETDISQETSLEEDALEVSNPEENTLVDEETPTPTITPSETSLEETTEESLQNDELSQ